MTRWLTRFALPGVAALAGAALLLGNAAGGVKSSPAAGEWWLAAVDATGLSPPGPGRPVIIVDRGLDLAHPDLAGRPNTVALNPQTFRHEDTDGFHETGLASIVGAPGRPGGLLGVYPQARLYSWDASPDGLLDTVYVLPGMAAAAKLCPGVVLLSFGLSGDQIRSCDREPARGRGPRRRPRMPGGRVDGERPQPRKPAVLSG